MPEMGQKLARFASKIPKKIANLNFIPKIDTI